MYVLNDKDRQRIVEFKKELLELCRKHGCYYGYCPETDTDVVYLNEYESAAELIAAATVLVSGYKQ